MNREDYPIKVYKIHHEYSWEEPGDYFYSYGVQRDAEEDYTVELDYAEDDLCELYEDGTNDLDILADYLYDNYHYGEENTYTIYDENGDFICTIQD